jgi:2-keto-4-pentenoate hydratase
MNGPPPLLSTSNRVEFSSKRHEQLFAFQNSNCPVPLKEVRDAAMADAKMLSVWAARARESRRTPAQRSATENSEGPNERMTHDLMSHNDVEELARELLSASETGRMVDAPPSERPGFDLNTAYEVETTLKQFREAAGHRAVGRKVGYANKAMWRVLKLETLVWAHMYEDTVHYAENNSATLSFPHPRSLKIEPEIIFGLKAPVTGESSDAAAALASSDWLALGFEIIDCPFPDWKFQPSDFVASFGLHAALVAGERIQVRPDLIATLIDELPRFKVRMSKSGEIVEEGSGRNSLKSPALCLAELGAAITRRFPSHPLSAGEIVSSGTLTAGHLTGKGDLWTADVEGIFLPALTLRLT